MKLWEAVLIGCDRRKQAFGNLFKWDASGECGSCVVGAAIEGALDTIENSAWVQDRLRQKFPVLGRAIKWPQHLMQRETAIPQYQLEAVMISLNDVGKLSRERIALELIKPLEEEDEPSR